MSKKRFFYHYYRQYKCLSIHYNGTCTKINNVKCSVPVETKWNKTQPNLVIQGFANDVTYIEDKSGITAIIK